MSEYRFYPLSELAQGVRNDDPLLDLLRQQCRRHNRSDQSFNAIANGAIRQLHAVHDQVGRPLTRSEAWSVFRPLLDSHGLTSEQADEVAATMDSALWAMVGEDAAQANEEAAARERISDWLGALDDAIDEHIAQHGREPDDLTREMVDDLHRTCLVPGGLDYVAAVQGWWNSEDEDAIQPQMPADVWQAFTEHKEAGIALEPDAPAAQPEPKKETEIMPNFTGDADKLLEYTDVKRLMATPAYKGDPNCDPAEIAAVRAKVSEWYEGTFANDEADTRGRSQVLVGVSTEDEPEHDQRHPLERPDRVVNPER